MLSKNPPIFRDNDFDIITTISLQLCLIFYIERCLHEAKYVSKLVLFLTTSRNYLRFDFVGLLKKMFPAFCIVNEIITIFVGVNRNK